VSHDRYLINALASQIWEIDVKEENLINALASQIWEIDVKEENLNVFEGSYQAYQTQLREEFHLEQDLDTISDDFSGNFKDQKQAKNLALAADRKRASRLVEVEKEIADLERIVNILGEKLGDPPEDPDLVVKMGFEYKAAESELEELLQEWEELQKD